MIIIPRQHYKIYTPVQLINSVIFILTIVYNEY